MELRDNNFGSRETYYTYERDNIDYESFLEDTLYSLPPEIVQHGLENIEKETSSFPIGSTTEKTLDSFTEYLRSKDVETNDLSQAIDATTVRILKSLKGIYNSASNEEALLILHVVCSSYILRGEAALERELLKNGLTLDQHMRENNAPRNIQRHVNKEEMGRALANVVYIFNQSLE
jgi:hypothetical protein